MRTFHFFSFNHLWSTAPGSHHSGFLMVQLGSRAESRWVCQRMAPPVTRTSLLITLIKVFQLHFLLQ